jgi:hypothetical protein
MHHNNDHYMNRPTGPPVPKSNPVISRPAPAPPVKDDWESRLNFPSFPYQQVSTITFQPPNNREYPSEYSLD